MHIYIYILWDTYFCIFLSNWTEHDCTYKNPFASKSNEIPFCSKSNRKFSVRPYLESDIPSESAHRNLSEPEIYFPESHLDDKFSIANSECTEIARILFPFKLNGIWSWWQFSFRYWTKWNSIWFKIKTKTVSKIVSHSN